MSSLQARVQVLIENPSELGSLTTRLNRLLAANCPSNRFITFFLGILDTVTGEMVYCNAGHNPPLLVRADGRVDELEGGGPILGILPTVVYQEHRCRTEPGDMIVLYSDGVTEATSAEEEEFGEHRLAQLLVSLRTEPARAVIEKVNQAIVEFTGGAPPADDLTLVVARRLAD